jgi:hypothetical protein
MDPIGALTVAKKKSESRRFNTLVRMDDDLCDKARVLAAMRKVSMAEMFTDMLRPLVERELEKEYAKRAKRPKGDTD